MSTDCFRGIAATEPQRFPLAPILTALNDALEADPVAVHALISTRVQCNARLADHPTVQVGITPTSFEVGALGLLNGVIEVATGKRVAAQWVQTEPGREELVGFIEWEGHPVTITERAEAACS